MRFDSGEGAASSALGAGPSRGNMERTAPSGPSSNPGNCDCKIYENYSLSEARGVKYFCIALGPYKDISLSVTFHISSLSFGPRKKKLVHWTEEFFAKNSVHQIFNFCQEAINF